MAEAPQGSTLRALVRFSLAETALIAVLAVLLTTFVWSDEASTRAVWLSAAMSAAVQVVTFASAARAGRLHVMTAWGVGVLLRMAVVALWAFVGVPALSLSMTPALLSLVIFLFVSTLIEPFFLNA